VKVDRISGSLQGHFHRKKLFGGSEEYDFGLAIDDGGLSLEIDVGIRRQKIDGKDVPTLRVFTCNVNADNNRVRIINTSNDFGMKVIIGLLNGAKGLIIGAVQSTLNLTFPRIANSLLDKFNHES